MLEAVLNEVEREYDELLFDLPLWEAQEIVLEKAGFEDFESKEARRFFAQFHKFYNERVY